MLHMQKELIQSNEYRLYFILSVLVQTLHYSNMYRLEAILYTNQIVCFFSKKVDMMNP